LYRRAFGSNFPPKPQQSAGDREESNMAQAPTNFGSLDDFQKGGVEIITGDVRHFVFSNIFEVASRAAPYERVVVGKNLNYVQEVMRAEGVSPWMACSHDEFALCMDGEVTVEFVKLKAPPAAEREGAILVGSEPEGARMGYVRLKRGHQALLPAGAAYRFTAVKTGVILQQTILGELSVEKWRDICLN
jgi:hypothetical protein